LDPKENLPRDYSRIFQFQNFTRARKRIEKIHTGINSGQWVTIHVLDVPHGTIQNHPPEFPLVLSGIFKHENKMSVANFAIHRVSHFNDSLRSKEELLFHCGFRRYKASPIFSDSSRKTDKHKLEKYFHPASRGSVASVYAPITFPPVPLLVFKQIGTDWKFVATGSLLDINPDRLIIKRIILTGRAIKINKNRVVMRDMFYTPEDIRWFKPVQLWTKYGRVGHIKDSIGTHGKAKCFFDSTLKSQDTICMSLYKRVFPKWSILPELPRPQNSAEQIPKIEPTVLDTQTINNSEKKEQGTMETQ